MAGLGLDARMLANTNDDLKKKVAGSPTSTRSSRSLPRRRRLRVPVPARRRGQPVVRAHSLIVGNCGMLQAGATLLPDAEIDGRCVRHRRDAAPRVLRVGPDRRPGVLGERDPALVPPLEDRADPGRQAHRHRGPRRTTAALHPRSGVRGAARASGRVRDRRRPGRARSWRSRRASTPVGCGCARPDRRTRPATRAGSRTPTADAGPFRRACACWDGERPAQPEARRTTEDERSVVAARRCRTSRSAGLGRAARLGLDVGLGRARVGRAPVLGLGLGHRALGLGPRSLGSPETIARSQSAPRRTPRPSSARRPPGGSRRRAGTTRGTSRGG